MLGLLLEFCVAFVPLSSALAFEGDADLTRFVTRPDIKAPLFEIITYDRDSLDPGYWFIGPYATLFQGNPHANLHKSCQTGPHIYDYEGELVWSGACAFDNRVACDVRAFHANDTTFVSTIFVPDANDAKGHGIVMSNSYETVKRLSAPPGTSGFNMHELTFVDNGSRALYVVNKPMFVDMADLINGTDSGWIIDLGIHEVDLATGELTFEWWGFDHIALSESSAALQDYSNRASGWDWLHINSVNKNDDGDFLMSARNTNCIYKISGENGTILWRLGGTDSDFALIDFNFSRQHDAQWITYDGEVEIISFLDNGADNLGYSTSATSSALVVRLDKTTDQPHASVIERIWRPDDGVSQLRGNFQILPNGNRVIGWSENAYITEHALDGRLLMKASFQSERFVTYRAHKLSFEGFPAEKPVLHAAAYRAGDSAITAYYVSWNGATNVGSWRFWRENSPGVDATFIGETPRTGFETAFQSEGCETLVFAEAISRDEISLGVTETFAIREVSAGRRQSAEAMEREREEADISNEKDEL